MKRIIALSLMIFSLGFGASLAQAEPFGIGYPSDLVENKSQGTSSSDSEDPLKSVYPDIAEI